MTGHDHAELAGGRLSTWRRKEDGRGRRTKDAWEMFHISSVFFPLESVLCWISMAVWAHLDHLIIYSCVVKRPVLKKKKEHFPSDLRLRHTDCQKCKILERLPVPNLQTNHFFHHEATIQKQLTLWQTFENKARSQTQSDEACQIQQRKLHASPSHICFKFNYGYFFKANSNSGLKYFLCHFLPFMCLETQRWRSDLTAQASRDSLDI